MFVDDVFYYRATFCECEGAVHCYGGDAKGPHCFEWRRREEGATLVELAVLRKACRSARFGRDGGGSSGLLASCQMRPGTMHAGRSIFVNSLTWGKEQR